MCLFPRLIYNKKYTANKKNGGNIPAILDQRTKLVPIGCGKCIECSKKKAREWQVRLLEDVRHNTNGKFVTMTFSNKSIKQLASLTKGLKGYEKDNEIAKIAVRRFLERWRKKYKKSVRHWLVTELGHNGTENIHLHGIIWTDNTMEEIEEIWQYGWMWKGKKKINGKLENYVSERTVNYITKYISKRDNINKEYKPRILTSAGIGKGYMERTDWIKNKFNGEETREYYKTKTGHKMAMPIYWRNKIYNEEEREKLWINILNKEERWILGNKIDISNNENEYYEALKHARIKNHRLGYGNDAKNWNRIAYENERRELRIRERITGKSVEEELKESAIKWGMADTQESGRIVLRTDEKKLITKESHK